MQSKMGLRILGDSLLQRQEPKTIVLQKGHLGDKSDDRVAHLNSILAPRGWEFERSSLQKFKCPRFPRGMGGLKFRFDRRIAPHRPAQRYTTIHNAPKPYTILQSHTPHYITLHNATWLRNPKSPHVMLHNLTQPYTALHIPIYSQQGDLSWKIKTFCQAKPKENL